MDTAYFEEENFTGINYTEKAMPKGEYENCRFDNCDCSGSNLNNIVFSDCVFDGCNLSLAKIEQAAFKNVRFNHCKLTGLQFGACNSFLFNVSFDHCMLQLASFYKMPLKKTPFLHCQLLETDFSEADLSGAVFVQCDLNGAVFDRTILEKADLRQAFNYSINPEKNRIKKAKFSLAGLAGLLDHYDISISM